MPTTLTALLGNFVIGAAAIPAVLILGYFVSFDATWQQLQLDLKSVIAFLNANSNTAWLFTGIVAVVCVIVGIVLDLVGHKVVDDLLFNISREKVVPENERKVIISSTPDGTFLKFDTMLQSYFYAHAPEHLLQYHSEQWSYCEFCRNAAIVALLYLVAGSLIFIKLRYWGWSILWCLFWAIMIYIILLVLKFGIAYYYRVETVFAIGWLREKGLLKDSMIIDQSSLAADASSSGSLTRNS